MSNAPEQLPAHLRPITVESPSPGRRSRRSPYTNCSTICVRESGKSMASDRRICSGSNCGLPTQTTATTHCPPLSQNHSPDRPPWWPRPLLATGLQHIILLFDQDGHPVVPTCAPFSSPRTAAVKHARRAPPKAAQSVLDGLEHGGIIAPVGRHVPEARAVYTRVLTAANKGRQVETDNGIERVGCRAALEAIGKCFSDWGGRQDL